MKNFNLSQFLGCCVIGIARGEARVIYRIVRLGYAVHISEGYYQTERSPFTFIDIKGGCICRRRDRSYFDILPRIRVKATAAGVERSGDTKQVNVFPDIVRAEIGIQRR